MRLVRCLRWFRIKREKWFRCDGKLKNIPLLGTEEVADFIPAKEGAYPEGVIGIRAPQSEDLVFRAGKTLEYRTEQEDFEGKAGVIRRMKDGSLQLALIRGTKIAADGVRSVDGSRG